MVFFWALLQGLLSLKQVSALKHLMMTTVLHTLKVQKAQFYVGKPQGPCHMVVGVTTL